MGLVFSWMIDKYFKIIVDDHSNLYQFMGYLVGILKLADLTKYDG